MPLLFYDHPHASYKSRSITETWQGGGRGSNSDNDSNFRYVFTQPLLYQTKLFISTCDDDDVLDPKNDPNGVSFMNKA